MEHYKHLLKLNFKSNFWSCKFTINSNLNKKLGNNKLKQINEIMNVYTKMDKTIIKFGDTEIEKQKLHQHKTPILINNIDINRSM